MTAILNQIVISPRDFQKRGLRQLYQTVAGLSIVSPHGHVDPRLFATSATTFGTPADLFIIPDHYVRMLYSQGSKCSD
jgi:glucuronate isomerase